MPNTGAMEPAPRNTKASRRTVRAVLCTAVLVLAPAQSTVAQLNDPAYADYFLVGRFGEICTMCEAVVLCESGDDVPAHEAVPAGGSFTLYHIRTRTFWSQVGTIWEWFIANFNSESLASGHSRPAHVYDVSDGRWSGRRIVDAQVSLDPARLVFGARSIDRVERRWLDGDDERPVGYCQRLPLWESIEVISNRAPGGDDA